jgi:hypothetical protein
MLEAVDGELCLLELLQVMRCVLCMLEAVEVEFCFFVVGSFLMPGYVSCHGTGELLGVLQMFNDACETSIETDFGILYSRFLGFPLD